MRRYLQGLPGRDVGAVSGWMDVARALRSPGRHAHALGRVDQGVEVAVPLGQLRRWQGQHPVEVGELEMIVLPQAFTDDEIALLPEGVFGVSDDGIAHPEGCAQIARARLVPALDTFVHDLQGTLVVTR
jgi:hypothetical protein